MATNASPAAPRRELGPLRPDRIAFWPVEDSSYGIDVTFTGATGLAPAERWLEEVRRHGLVARLQQELGGAWTVRVGPLPVDDARSIVSSFIR